MAEARIYESVVTLSQLTSGPKMTTRVSRLRQYMKLLLRWRFCGLQYDKTSAVRKLSF